LGTHATKLQLGESQGSRQQPISREFTTHEPGASKLGVPKP